MKTRFLTPLVLLLAGVLAFADCFPQITYWWFCSAWTQGVRLTRLQGLMDDGAA